MLSSHSHNTNTMKTEIIDNRNRETFSTGNWWGIVWFGESEMALDFNTKKQAAWFVNGGYKQFEF